MRKRPFIMHIPEVIIRRDDHLPIEKFRQMDYLAIEEYLLPIELMMENAGLHLARLVSHILPDPRNVLLGIGPGNNGGGGLVAARRLAAWGYEVSLDLPLKEMNPLAQTQLARALAAGVKLQATNMPDIFVDAYFGFSQRLPLHPSIQLALERGNKLSCPKISLDIPTGFDNVSGECIFNPGMVLTLGAMKSELFKLKAKTEFYLADLGLPASVYENFHISYPPEFRTSGLLHCVFQQ